jgi:hypothetical protein
MLSDNSTVLTLAQRLNDRFGKSSSSPSRLPFFLWIGP